MEEEKMIKKPETAEEMFAMLKEFFVGGKVSVDEGQKVWDVLTALRGPDEPQNFYSAPNGPQVAIKSKRASTAVIRYALFGPAIEKFGVVANEDSEEFATFRQDRRGRTDNNLEFDLAPRNYLADSPHYTRHVKNAFNALGLKWDQKNVF